MDNYINYDAITINLLVSTGIHNSIQLYSDQLFRLKSPRAATIT